MSQHTYCQHLYPQDIIQLQLWVWYINSVLTFFYILLTFTGVLAPEITSVSELINITSVQVTWNQPKGGLAVDEYVVAYHRLNGRDGQCSSFQDGGSVTINSSMGDGLTNTMFLLNHLQAFSVYVVDLTGRTGSLYNTSVPFQFETNLKGILYQCCIQVTAWHEYCN